MSSGDPRVGVRVHKHTRTVFGLFGWRSAVGSVPGRPARLETALKQTLLIRAKGMTIP